MKQNLRIGGQTFEKTELTRIRDFLSPLSSSKAIKLDLTGAVVLSSYCFKTYNNYFIFIFIYLFFYNSKCCWPGRTSLWEDIAKGHRYREAWKIRAINRLNLQSCTSKGSIEK